MHNTTLYNGEIELSFDEANHRYSVNGSIVPGVTTPLGIINKEWMGPWVAKMCGEYVADNLKPGASLDEIEIQDFIKSMKGSWRRKSATAAAIGTMVHEWAEKHAKGLKPAMPVNPKIRNGVEAYLDWLKQHEIVFRANERRIYSRQYRYAGTVDAIGYVDGQLSVIDFKTSSGIYPEMAWQTAAYQHALQEEFGKPFERRWIIRFDKEGGGFESEAFDNFDADFEVFRTALSLWRQVKGVH